MLIQILEANGYSQSAINIYSKLGEIITGECRDEKRSAVNILVSRLAHKLDQDFLGSYSNLSAIVSPTTGLSHIDEQHCYKKNIRIFSLQQHKNELSRISSTSELCFGLMLNLLRGINEAHNHVVQENQWNRDQFKSRQLSEMTLGLIGLGRIGTHMANHARAFGMKLVACDPDVSNTRFNELSVEKTDIDQLCRVADIISIHANESDENYHLVNKHQIALMKHDALIINTARGSLLNESAAVEALREKRLAGIACDVLEDELKPEFPASSVLVKAAREGLNVLLTPHLGGCTKDAMHITEEMLANSVYQELGQTHGCA